MSYRGISVWEDHGVHLDDLVLAQQAVGTVRLEAPTNGRVPGTPVPLPDVLLVISGVGLQVLEHSYGQPTASWTQYY